MAVIQTRQVEDTSFPYTTSNLVEDKGEYGRVVVYAHRWRSGVLDRGNFDIWNYESGRVDASNVRLEAGSWGKDELHSVTGSGTNRVRFEFIPGPRFEQGMQARLTVTYEARIAAQATISGDIEESGVSVEATSSVELSAFGEATRLDVGVVATAGRVEVKRKTETTLRARGAVTASASVSGNAQVDAAGGVTGGGTATGTREVGGSTDVERVASEEQTLTRQGAERTIDTENLIFPATKVFVFTNAARRSDWFDASSSGTAATSVGTDNGAATTEIDVQTSWDAVVEILDSDGRVLALLDFELDPERMAMLDRQFALLDMHERGVPMVLAAKVLGIKSQGELRGLLAVQTLKGYRPSRKALTAAYALP